MAKLMLCNYNDMVKLYLYYVKLYKCLILSDKTIVCFPCATTVIARYNVKI